jgi:hypothetical protein
MDTNPYPPKWCRSDPIRLHSTGGQAPNYDVLTNVYSELPGRVGGEAGYGGEGGEVGLAGGHGDAAQQEVHGRVPVTHIL